MGFSRQEYWNELPFLSPGDLPDPAIEPMSLTSPALADSFFTTSTTWEAWAHSLLKVLKKVKVLVTQLCLILCYPMDCTHQAPLPWNSPGKDTGVGSHSLLQGIFPITLPW